MFSEISCMVILVTTTACSAAIIAQKLLFDRAAPIYELHPS